jgi:hypothetical protein
MLAYILFFSIQPVSICVFLIGEARCCVPCLSWLKSRVKWRGSCHGGGELEVVIYPE